MNRCHATRRGFLPSWFSRCSLYLCTLCVPVGTLFFLPSLASAQAPAKNQNVTRTRRPNPLQELLDRAEKAIAEQKFADAVAALDEFLKEQPGDAYAHFQLAYAHTALGDWRKAAASYRRAAELKPDMAAAHLNLGLLLYEHDSPQAAIEPLHRAAELLTNEARPHFLLGTALERAGRQPASVYRACTIYTTLSPCPMCSGAIVLYGIPRVVVGENVTFQGEEDWLRARGVEVVVVQDEECIALMRAFIAAHPGLWNEDIGV